MEKIRLYHNPACSKSRGALELLGERGVDFEVREYLCDPLARQDLEKILDALPVEPSELVRRDKNFRELALDEQAVKTREEVIAVLLEHPKLMQRPIVLRGASGVIARPPEKLLELLSDTQEPDS